ncbi:hypothetical protein [Polluticaenibacter yanchengensis]|uniref:Carboxypeptidase-like regulatory domain-containing protein n=1 Tax=Polluticaenibacter yanchengensis TaxID=3014562 RepID=A0ABT4UIE1_9BACT|nr:hypothetical protein [Chitinophagaceae bacterium LY-5]
MKLLLFVLLISLSLVSYSKEIIVYDKDARKPIANAYVENKKGQVLTYTDDSGFAIVNQNQFFVKHISYKEIYVDTNALKSDTIFLDINIDELEAVEVLKEYKVLRTVTIKGRKINKRIGYSMSMHLFRTLFSLIDIDTSVSKYRIKSIKPRFFDYNEGGDNRSKISITVYQYAPFSDTVLPKLIPVSQPVTKTFKESKKNPKFIINSNIMVNKSGKFLVLFKTELPKDYASGNHFMYIKYNENIDQQRVFIVNERRNGFLYKENRELIMDIEIEEVE